MLNKALLLAAASKTTLIEADGLLSRFRVTPNLEDGLVGMIRVNGQGVGGYSLLQGEDIIIDFGGGYMYGYVISNRYNVPVVMSIPYGGETPKIFKLVNETTGYEVYGIGQSYEANFMFTSKADADAYISNGTMASMADPIWTEDDVGKPCTISIYLLDTPELQFTLGEQVGSFSIKVGQLDRTDSATGEVTTYLGYSTNLGYGGGVNGVGQYTYGTLVDGGNFGFVGFALNQNDKTVTVAINNPYNENLFSNGYIAVEINGSVYLKGSGRVASLGDTMFYKCSLYEGSDLTLTKNETITVKVYKVEAS